jgi:hypothetical protein
MMLMTFFMVLYFHAENKETEKELKKKKREEQQMKKDAQLKKNESFLASLNSFKETVTAVRIFDCSVNKVTPSLES